MSELVRLTFQNREEWLAGRGRGIGGSEAAAAIGMSPWKTPLTLWKEKIGAAKAPDLSGNAAVEQGRRMEAPIRAFFMAQHPEYELYYGEYDILFQNDRPWLFATLDGELTERAAGRKGILEIKTSTIQKSADWEKWRDQVPPNYYCQCLHQMLAAGYDFAILYAALYDYRGNLTFPPPYVFERTDREADLKWLLEKETSFWKSVETGTMPAQVLNF